MENGRELLLKQWQKLDNAVDNMDDGSDYHKIQGRAFAMVIADLMPMFFPTADDVVREAVARHKARVAGQEHITPGLAEEIWSNEYDWKGDKRTVVTVQKRTGKSLPAASLDTIKQGIQSGMFSVDDMAKTYGVTKQEVKQQLGLV